jgi:iron complex transport system ATP-binding protein
VSTLAVSDLGVQQGGRQILKGISFSAGAGDFVAVIGANGAGKSTLLRTLAGLQVPDQGTVTLDAHPLSAIPRRELARSRAYLPQNPRCEWPISVERVVALGLTPVLPALGGLPEPMRRQVDAALALCDLTSRRLQPATTLSGGELARAMLARALVSDPAVLIVDEPTTGLDPRHALDAATRLAAVARAGRLVIAAIHDLTLVARHATRVLALAGGRLAADGAMGETLTSSLVRELFGVEACVSLTPGGPFVDYLSAGAAVPTRGPTSPS